MRAGFGKCDEVILDREIEYAFDTDGLPRRSA
jgi:hypothetical protein